MPIRLMGNVGWRLGKTNWPRCVSPWRLRAVRIGRPAPLRFLCRRWWSAPPGSCRKRNPGPSTSMRFAPMREAVALELEGHTLLENIEHCERDVATIHTESKAFNVAVSFLYPLLSAEEITALLDGLDG